MPATKKATRKKPLTPAQRLAREKAIIADLRAGKMSYRQIAAKHSVSLPTVNSKARKAGIRRSRRGPAGLTRKTTGRAVRKTTARAAATRTATGRPARAGGRRTNRGGAPFQEQFRELVLAHYPDMSLRNFDKLNKAIEKALP